jgi:hypothetical protein
MLHYSAKRHADWEMRNCLVKRSNSREILWKQTTRKGEGGNLHHGQLSFTRWQQQQETKYSAFMKHDGPWSQFTPSHIVSLRFVLCFLWGTDWIYICYVEESRPPLWFSGQSSSLQNGDVLCSLWSTNWIYICYVEESRPPLWSRRQSSWRLGSIPGATRFFEK